MFCLSGVGVLSGQLYAPGGHDGPLVRKSVEVYEPGTNTWKQVADMNMCRRNAGNVRLLSSPLLRGSQFFPPALSDRKRGRIARVGSSPCVLNIRVAVCLSHRLCVSGRGNLESKMVASRCPAETQRSPFSLVLVWIVFLCHCLAERSS